MRLGETGVDLGSRREVSRTYPTVETVGLRRGLIAVARLGRRGVAVVILLLRTGAQGNAVVSGEFVKERAVSCRVRQERQRGPRQRQTGGVIRVVALGGGEGSWRGRAAVRGLIAGIARHDGVRCVLDMLGTASCVVGCGGEEASLRTLLQSRRRELEGWKRAARRKMRPDEPATRRDAMRCDKRA